jgi:hypothetical protein
MSVLVTSMVTTVPSTLGAPYGASPHVSAASTSADADERRVADVVRAATLAYFTENAIRLDARVQLAAAVMTEHAPTWPAVAAAGTLVVRLVAAMTGARDRAPDVRLMAAALEYTRTTLASDVAGRTRRSDALVRECALACTALVLARAHALDVAAYVAYARDVVGVTLSIADVTALVSASAPTRAGTSVYDMYEPLATLVDDDDDARTLRPLLVLAAFDARLAPNPLFTAAAALALAAPSARERLVRVLAAMRVGASAAAARAQLERYEAALVDVLVAVRHSPLLELVVPHGDARDAALELVARLATTTSG